MMTTTACSVISSLLLILAARHCKALLLDGHNCSLSGSQKLAAQQLTNLFENGAFNFDYGYCENINDGRGVTSGFAGFTTADGDALDLIKAYTADHPSNSLAKYIPALKLLNNTNSDSTTLLTGYCKAWASEATHTAFQEAQQGHVDSTYYQPSQQTADSLGLQYALSRAFIYDTIIQHGNGDDGDCLAAIVNRTNALQGGSPADGVDETVWLPSMINERRHDLIHPENAATAEQWAQSTDRTDAFAQLAETHQWALSGKIHFNTTDFPNESLASNSTMNPSSANCGQHRMSATESTGLTELASASHSCRLDLTVRAMFGMICLVCMLLIA